MQALNSTKGNALALVLTVMIVAGVGIAYIVNETAKKQFEVKDKEIVENVQDGMKAAKQLVVNEVVKTWSDAYNASSEGHTDLPAVEISTSALDAIVVDYLQNRFSARAGWVVDYTPRSTGTPLDMGRPLNADYYAETSGTGTDALQYSIGVVETWLQDGFNVKIGRLADPEDSSSKLVFGARVTAGGTNVDGKVIYPTNFAWMDVGSGVKNLTKNIRVTSPDYIKDKDANGAIIGISDNLVANRTGGVFFKGGLAATSLDKLSYKGSKPVFVKDGVKDGDNTLSSTSYVVNQTSTAGTNPNGTTEYLIEKTMYRSDAKSTDASLTNLSNEITQHTMITTESQVTGEMKLFSDVGTGREVPVTRFWEPASNPVRQNANVKITLGSANITTGTGSAIVPTITAINGVSTTTYSTGNSIVSTKRSLSNPNDYGAMFAINKEAVLNYYGDKWKTFFSGIQSMQGDPAVACSSEYAYGLSTPCFDAAWDTLVSNLTTAPGGVADIMPVREAYLDGAIRVQKFPEHSSAINGYYLVVDPVALDASTVNPKPNGVYVGIDPNDANVGVLKGRSLLIVGRRLANGGVFPIVDTNGEAPQIVENANYGTVLGNTKQFFGTDGRLIFDTRVNVDPGTALTTTGNIYKDSNVLEMKNSATESQMAAIYNKKSIFASKERIGIVNLSEVGTSTGLSEAEQIAAGLNPSYNATTLISGNGSFPGLYNPAQIITPVVFAEEIGTQLELPLRFQAINAKTNIGLKPTTFDSELTANSLTSADVISIQDLKNLDYVEANDEAVNTKLRTWARAKIKEIVGSPEWNGVANLYYNKGLNARLNSTDLSTEIKDALYEEILPTANIKRTEETAYIRVYAQRYGWTGTVTENLVARGDVNVRVGFKGNFKSRLIADCYETAASTSATKPVVLKDEALVTATGTAVNFTGVPAKKLITVAGEGSEVNTGYTFTHRNLVLYYPGPTNVKKLTGTGGLFPSYIAGTSADLTSYFNTTGIAQTDTINDKSTPAMSVAVSADVESVYGRLAAKLTNVVSKVTNSFITSSLNTGNSSDPWSTVGAQAPLFGRIEYTIAVSQNTAKPSNLTPGYQFYAGWTSDINDNPLDTPIKLYSVKLEQYASAPAANGVKSVPLTTSTVKATLPSLYDTVMQELVASVINDVSATGKLQLEVNKLINTATPLTTTFIKDYLDSISTFGMARTGATSVRTQALTNLPGGITGKREIDFNVTSIAVPYNTTTDGQASWDFYFASGDEGHTLGADRTLANNYGLGTFEAMITDQIASDVSSTLNVSTSQLLPTRAVLKDSGAVVGPVLRNVAISGDRTHAMTAYEPVWTNFNAEITGSPYINTTVTKTENAFLSETVKSAVYKRDVKFTLYARLLGNFNPPQAGTLKSFTGVGVLMTGASTPEPELLSNAAVSADVGFTWIGTVITSIGNTGTNDGATNTLPVTLVGDPLLVGPPAMTPQNFNTEQASNAIQIARQGLWGTIVIVEDKSKEGEVEIDLNPVPRTEVR